MRYLFRTKSAPVLASVALLVSFSVLGGSSRAELKPERTVESAYEGSAGIVTPGTDAHATALEGRVFFKSEAKERFVSIAITDDNGGSVRAGIFIDKNGDGRYSGRRVDICGATLSPIAIPSRVNVMVELYLGTCEDGTPSTATSGVVTATFTR